MGPLFFGDDFHQIELNLDGIIIFGQANPLAHSMNMGVDNNTRYPKSVS
jgi:hypothetical protein